MSMSATAACNQCDLFTFNLNNVPSCQSGTYIQNACISARGNVVTLSVSTSLSPTCYGQYGLQVTQGRVLNVDPANSYVFPAQPSESAKVLGMPLYAVIGIAVGAGVVLIVAGVFAVRKLRLRQDMARVEAVNMSQGDAMDQGLIQDT